MSNTNTHSVPISRKVVKRPLAIIVSVILLLSSIVPIMAMADSTNGGGQIELLGSPEATSLGNMQIDILDATTNSPLTAKGDGYEWDYIDNCFYITQLSLWPDAAAPNKTFTLVAPNNMRFLAIPSRPDGIASATTATENGRNVMKITYSNDVAIGEQIVLGITTYTTEYVYSVDASKNPIAQMKNATVTRIGKDIIAAAKASSPTPIYDTQITIEGNKALAVNLYPKKYATEDLFTGLFAVMPYGPLARQQVIPPDLFLRATTRTIGAWENGAAFNSIRWYMLDNPINHDPYWDMELKIILPSGIDIVAGGPTVYNDSGDRYILYSDIDLTNDRGANPLANPLAVGDQRKLGGKAPNSILYGNNTGDLDFRIPAEIFVLNPAEELVADKTYAFDISVSYRNVDGLQEESFAPYYITTEAFTKVDSHSMDYEFAAGGDARSYISVFDVPQGKITDTADWKEFINIKGTAKETEFNDLHVGGSITVEPGLGYNMLEGTIGNATSAKYWLEGDTTEYTATSLGAGKFKFTEALSPDRVSRVDFVFANGLAALGNESLTFTMKIEADTMSVDDYESSVKLSIKNKDGDVCTGLSSTHVKIFPVWLRKPQDILLVQTGGNNDNTQSSFLSEQSVNKVNAMFVSFGYEGILPGLLQGKWKEYSDFVLDLGDNQDNKLLETLSGEIYVNANISTEGAKFYYTTNLNPQERYADVGDAGSFEVMSTGTGRTANLNLDNGEYITSLRFVADRFMVTRVSRNLISATEPDYMSNAVFYGGSNSDRDIRMAYNAFIEFFSKTDREFPSDSEPIKHYDANDKTNTSYTFNASYYSSDMTAQRDALISTYWLVRFQRYINSNFYLDGFDLPPSIGTGGSFNVSIKLRYGMAGSVSTFGETPLKNRKLLVKLNDGFVYTGDDSNVRVVEKDGATYLIVGEERPLDTPSGYLVLPLMALSTVTPGIATPIERIWWDMTDTVDFERASNTPPYLIPTNSGITHVNPLAEIGYGSSEISLCDVGGGTMTVNNIKQLSVKLYPGYSSVIIAGQNGLTFFEDTKDKLTASVMIEASAQTTNYRTVIHLPTKGEEITGGQQGEIKNTAEFTLRLKEALQSDVFDGVSATLRYSADGSAWLSKDGVTDWSEITDIEVVFASFPANKAVMVKLPVEPTQLGSDTKSYITATHESSTHNKIITNVATYNYHLNNVDVHYYANHDIAAESDVIGSDGEYLTLLKTNIPYNSSLDVPESPKRTGYTFKDWYREPVCTYKWNFDTDKVTDHTKLYANWAADTYLITFHPNTGTGSMANQTATYDQYLKLTANSFVKSGYAFTGWNTVAAGDEVGYSNEQSWSKWTKTGGLDLYAQWVAIPYAVSYAAGGSDVSGLPNSGTATVGDSYTVSSTIPTRSGYTFNGWVATSGLGGNYSGGDNFTMPASNVVLTASWKPVPVVEPPVVTPVTYNVSYDGGGDNVTGLPGGATLEESATYTVSGNIPVRDGYIFLGWIMTSGGSGSYNGGDRFVMPASDVVLTASWEEIIAEPAEPSAPTASKEQTTSKVQSNTAAKLEAQTGNIVTDLFNGNVPLGSVGFHGAWSLLSFLMSLVAFVIAVLLVVGTVLRRREENNEYGEARRFENDEEESRRRRGKFLKLLTVIVGIFTPIVWLILDNLNQPVVWINRWTIFVAVVFVVHIVLLVVYKIRKKNDEDDKKNEYGRVVA